jgi:WD40 repeat protein
MAPRTRPVSHGNRAGSPDSESESLSSSSSSLRGRDSEGGEPARKRRLVGEFSGEPAASAAAAVADEAADEAAERISTVHDVLPRFRHKLGWRTRAACLMYCHELLRAAVGENIVGGGRRLGLSALPPELLQLIGCHLTIVEGNDVVRFVHPEELECVARLPGHGKKTIHALECFKSADGRQFLASAGGNTVKVWDLVSLECVATLNGQSMGGRSCISCLASFSDANGVPSLVSGCDDGTISLWDVASHTQVASVKVEDGSKNWPKSILSLVVYRNATGLPCLASGVCLSIALWDMDLTPIATLRCDHNVRSLCVFRGPHNIDFLVSGESNTDNETVDTSLQVWDVAACENVFTLHGHKDSVVSLACFTSEDGIPMLVSGSTDYVVKVWDLVSRKEVETLDIGYFPSSLTCAAGVDDRVLMVCLSGGTPVARFFDLSTERTIVDRACHYQGALGTFNDGAPFFASALAGAIDVWSCRS